MKVLVISAYFPPHNAIGSVRLGGLCDYLVSEGHEVKVVSAEHEDLPKNLETKLDPTSIYPVRWRSVAKTVNQNLTILKARRSPAIEGGANISKNWYGQLKAFFLWPDNYAGWFKPALSQAREIVKVWEPDLIYASALPFTSLRIANILSSETGVPWVAEFRDLWVGNHYNYVPYWRKIIDTKIEKKVLKSCSFLVTVSEPLAESLTKTHKKETLVILSGYDHPTGVWSPRKKKTDPLEIVYTGMIYPGRRDPTILFQAISRLNWDQKDINVNFYGNRLPGLQKLVDTHGLRNVVNIYNSVSHAQSLDLQRNADLLLLLLWNTESEKGVFTGKLFEYIGSRRKIICLGLRDGVAASLVKEKNLGIVASESEKLASALNLWLKEKRQNGFVSLTDKKSIQGLSKADQFSKLLNQLTFVKQKDLLRRKIIFVLPGINRGGTERHVLQIASRLKKIFDVSIVTLEPLGGLRRDFEEAGLSVSSLNPNKISNLLSFIRLVMLFRREKEALFHFFLPKAYVIGGLAWALFGSRKSHLFMSRRSLSLYQQKHFFARFVEIFLHQKMDLIFANCKMIAEELLLEGITNQKLKLIYNGVETRSKAEKLSRKKDTCIKNRSDGGFTMVCLANLIHYKGHSDLIKALSIISKELPEKWRMLFAGRDDGLREYLSDLCGSLDLLDKVEFLDEVIDTDKLLQNADIVVSASHQEGLSNSVLEAMAQGVSLVATDVGGNSELVINGVNGLLVEPHNPSQLSKAILTLAMNPELRCKFGNASIEMVENKFTMENCIQNYVECYAEQFRSRNLK